MKEKPLSLDETWDECLKMWKWISENYRFFASPFFNTEKAKDYYLTNIRKAIKKPNADCFFCDYVDQEYREGGLSKCSSCPGRLVDDKFHCVDELYSYTNHPVKFYKKLVSLNARRKNEKN